MEITLLIMEIMEKSWNHVFVEPCNITMSLSVSAAIGDPCDGVSVLCPSNAQCIGSPPLCQCSDGYLDKSGVCTQRKFVSTSLCLCPF